MMSYTEKWIVFMIKVPSQISSLFESVLEQHAIPLAEHASYRKSGSGLRLWEFKFKFPV